MNIKYRLLNKLFIFLCKKYHRKFFNSTVDIKKIQKKILFDIIMKNRKTKYLEQFSVSDILKDDDFLKEFQKRVPIVDYIDIEIFIERIKNGEKNILFVDDIKLFELTSGSTTATKYIPYTDSFLKTYTSAVYVWLYDLYENNKGLYKGSVYWSLSPMLKRERSTKGNIKVGIEDDTSYFSKFSSYILNKIFVVPKEIKNIENIEDFLLLTSVFLLLARKLTMISIWSPSFLLILFDFIDKNKIKILKLLEEKNLENVKFKDSNIGDKNYFKSIKKKYKKNWSKERVEFLKINLLSKGNNLNFSEIWKNLKIISCWTDSSSFEFFIKLKEKFPQVKFQGKGLMSTECILSFPLTKISKGSIIAYNSFFYEFIEIGSSFHKNEKSIKLLQELELGKQYIVIVTTSAGLYRYNTNDVIEVVDFYEGIALIKFIGRNNKFSDIVGEKLESSFVEKQLEKLFKELNIDREFNLFAPTSLKSNYNNKKIIFYTLFLELKNKNIERDKLKLLEDKINLYLCEAYHYNYALELKQLERARIFLIEEKNALKIYMKEKLKTQKLGDIKFQILDNRFGWERKFKGGFISDENSFFSSSRSNV